MKFKPIIADPATMYAAGLRTLSQALILVHLGRCGLQGGTCASVCAEVKSIPNHTVYAVLERLREMKLVVHYCRQNSQGRAGRYVISVPGWELLTRPPSFEMFPDAATVLPTGKDAAK